jgi:hypothetical protein
MNASTSQMKTENLNRVDYRLPDSGKTVPAFVVCQTGEATLLFVPDFKSNRPHSIVIAHDDDLDGVFQDSEMNWFNVESDDMAEIGQNLLTLSKSLK